VSKNTQENKVTLPVVSVSGEQVGDIEVSAKLFGAEVKEHLVHEVVLAYLANQRQGTAATKTRGEVAGSTRKLYRQKGTGRARAGSRKSPTRKGGGVIFGPEPRSYRQNLPKQVRRQALCSALTVKTTEGEIHVLDALELNEISTKAVADIVKALEMEDGVMLITDTPDEILGKSTRNLASLKLIRAQDLNTYEVLNSKHILFTKEGLDKIQEVLA